MSSGANQSTCDDPFRAFLSWICPNPPSSSVSPSGSPAQSPKQLGKVHQEPPPMVIPMINLARSTSSFPAVPMPATGQTDAWRALGAILKALKTGVDIFPPLKTAVSELLECTMHVQIAKQNQQEYDRLASDLVDLVQTLQTRLPDSKPRWMPYSIENVACTISEQAAHIKQQQGRSGLRQAIQASGDGLDVIGCYRRIEHLFRQLQTDISLSVWDLAHEQWVDTRLKDLNPVHDARHNAALSMDMQRRGCTPNTRVKILEEAMDWARNLDAARIYWMNGMAGTGKTTIAYSLCERLEESRQLGACFFCSRVSVDCRNVNRIMPTIAYQLARFSNPYQKELCEVLTNNPDVSKREISVQFERLIVGPLLKVSDAIPTDALVVIDALDECSDTRGTQLVLELLFRHATGLPVKFFVTSRPEPSISNRVDSAKDIYRFVLHLHDVEESLVQEDIHTYLVDELKPIKVKPDDIERLTIRAGCLFIFAATVVRYIEPYDTTVDHGERLAAIIGAHTEAEGKAYRELDELYLAILSQALSTKGSEGEMRRLVLRTLICAREPLDISALTELTGYRSEETVRLALLPLQSVLRVAADTRVVSALHASFSDFMLNPDRSKEFHSDISKQNTYMATRCFEIMRRSLKFNICNLKTSSQLDQGVPGLEHRVKNAISSGLSYASRYWGDHLYGATHSNILVSMLSEFLQHRLLYWMEVLNLKDWIGYAAVILLHAFNSLPAEDNLSDLRLLLQDSRNFVTTYAASPASHSTPHIYISALPLVPTQSRVRDVYWSRFKGLARIEGTAINDRGDVALATWATGDWVTKLALSKDGRRMASAAGDGSVTVWDIGNGRRILGPLKKHQRIIWSIAFSPDGTRVASGSYDSKIYIWNAYSGDTLPGLFEGHNGSITGLLFSPDGTRLISCCEDHTIRIWDPLTGAQIGAELRGHQDSVMSIALSSNGDHLVSGSDDNTIRVWDLKTCKTVVGPLEGHTDWVDCVALSPDNKYIASSSRDCSVRVWSIEHQKVALEPLVGHTDRVWCVAYSPDGEKIASGSYDQTIRVWSTETGDLIAGPFRHEAAVYSAAFSHDGTEIISGSGDNTICIWDANRSIVGTNTALGGHTSGIMSIALAPNGARVVSGSSDHTLCIWDTYNGALVAGPLTGHIDEVWSVAYTPDSAYTVSGSLDRTVRMWDAHTGLPVSNPFTGHTDGVTVVAVSSNGTLVVSGSKDGSIKIWGLRGGTEVANPLVHHTDWVQAVEFSPNGAYIASGSEDSSVCLWDTNLGLLVWKFERHTDRVASVRFSPDGQKILSGSGDHTLLVWDVNTGAVLSGPWEGHNSPVWAASFSPDGAKVASGAQDGMLYLWDAEKGTVLATSFKGHTGPVYSVVFTPNNKRIISGSLDSTIRFWDLNSANDGQYQDDGSWMTQDNGWIKDSESRLVLWLPPDLKRIIPAPPCLFVIRPEGSVQTNLDNFIYGDRWRDCYTMSPNPGISDI
ncbi:unnamed protein product [Rhizoctonia solani]|uniref:NACHT domain-containing protein n=1 Tax=Rhizoctonia solani TaxID=456999 RepID=A0A8H3CYV8_9AGAM|nr:unnamed protein product [Rhizoctonia solani]